MPVSRFVLIGDETTGRAVVVDPRRDVGVYLEEAAARRLPIERVIETHEHADFVGGHLELASETGAVISYGAGADVAFPVEHLHDGQRLSLGEVTFEVLATPGHTPESICIVVYEHPDDEVPYGVLTGDTLFVGDVGRPDLLASAGLGLTADVLARRLYSRCTTSCWRCPIRRVSFPPTGRAPRVAGSCRARPAPRWASNARPTTPCSPWMRTPSSPSSPKASRRDRRTSRSTRNATASCIRCSTTGWLAAAVFLEINEIQVTHVSNDAVYDFVIAVTVGRDEVATITAHLRALVEL